jgi:hypothetical protein
MQRCVLGLLALGGGDGVNVKRGEQLNASAGSGRLGMS